MSWIVTKVCNCPVAPPKAAISLTDTAIMPSHTAKKKNFILESPWIFAAAASILLAIVLSFTINNLHREQQLIEKNLVNQGKGIIRLLFAGARAEAMPRRLTQDRHSFQQLIEQSVSDPGIVYIAVTDAEGVVLAHSEPEQIGRSLAGSIPKLTSARELLNRQNQDGPISIDELISHQRAYHYDTMVIEVAMMTRLDTTRGRAIRESPRGRELRMHPGGELQTANNNDSIFDGSTRIIIVGLDRSESEAALERNRQQIFFISLAMLLAGIGGWVALVNIRGHRLANSALEKEMQRQEQLVALGKMAAGVAHELRNPLSSIKGLATILGKQFPEGSREQENAWLLINEVERLNRSISELLDYARPLPLNKKETKINPLVENSLKLLRAEAESLGVRIEFHPDPEDRLAALDQDRISQLLLNIYLNALQAMPEGGILMVRVAPVPVDGGDKSGQVKKDARIKITISDTGCGMSQEVLAKAIDPYFTTKPQGSGLGLAMGKKIIEEHQGELSIESPGTGQGTKVTIVI